MRRDVYRAAPEDQKQREAWPKLAHYQHLAEELVRDYGCRVCLNMPLSPARNVRKGGKEVYSPGDVNTPL